MLADADTKRWFFSAMADRALGDNDAAKPGFIAAMDTPNRVVRKVTPVQEINRYDGDLLWAALASAR